MNINWDELRKEQFPALENSIYLKAAGGSPMCKTAYQEVLKYFYELHNVGDNFWERYFEDLDLTRKMISEYLNCESDEIALLINTSSGMNVLAHLLEKCEIIYPEGEFPSSILIFKLLGFDCHKINSQKNNTYLLEGIYKEIKETTKCLIHSHVQYLTGFKQDLNAIGDLCKKHDIINIINATQSFGALPINIKNQNIDALVASGLKWACSGYGAGILYIKNNLILENRMPFSSWLSVEDAFSMDNDNLKLIAKTKSMDGFGGTPNFPALFALKGSLTLIKKIGKGNIQMGIKEIRNRIISLTDQFVAKIKDLDFKIISPLDLKYRSGIITIESDKAEAIFNKLLTKNIQISLRNYPKSKEKTLLRFAFNYYNNFDDIEKTITILKDFK